MLLKWTLKSSGRSLITGLLKLVCRFFRFALRCVTRRAFVVRVTVEAAFIVSFLVPVYSQYRNPSDGGDSKMIKKTGVPQINLIEQIPKEYVNRYNRWKTMLLSVESGRQLWIKYAENPAYRLTIVVSKDKKQGASVEAHQWENGKLVGLTIILGSQINHGVPGNILYYPVLGSLSFIKDEDNYSGSDVLAAAKFAHELGHVANAAQSDTTTFQLQNELSPIFGERFLRNGHDPSDPLLAELVKRMGGTPEQIKLEREVWAETYALRFLMDKLKTKQIPSLLKRVRRSVISKFNLYPPPLRATWNSLTAAALQSEDLSLLK